MNNVLKVKKENKNFFILLLLNIVLTISFIELIKKVNFYIVTIPYFYHDHIDSIYNANLEKESLKLMKKEELIKLDGQDEITIIFRK